MGAAVPLRTDFSADDLRQLAKRAEDADQTRRLLSYGFRVIDSSGIPRIERSI